jgi:hypothetical protein
MYLIMEKPSHGVLADCYFERTISDDNPLPVQRNELLSENEVRFVDDSKFYA